jgi:hypothetical protein
MINQTENTQWRNKKEIAAHFGISVRHVTNLQRRRLLPHNKFGKSVRFNLRACDEAAKAMEIKSISQLNAHCE